MGRKRQMMMRFILFGICLLAAGIVTSPASSHAAAKDTEYIKKIEQAVLDSDTKIIQYQGGRIKAVIEEEWKKSSKLPLTAATLTISQKGWYTIRVTKKSGEKKLIYVYLKKKKYTITANTPVKMESGYYYMIPKADTEKVIEVKKASLSQGAKTALHTKGTAASRVWQLVDAGNGRFFLKNVNSGLYLGASSGETGAGSYFVQKKYKKGDKSVLFEALEGSGKYVLIRCRGNGQFLYTSQTQIIANARGRSKEWKFRFEKVSRPSSSIKATGYSYPVSVNYGQAFTLSGKVTSRYTMTSLTARIVDASGAAVQAKEATPGALTYQLSDIDADIRFGKLAVGNYRYQVLVKDSRGTEKTVIDKRFSVVMPAVSVTRTLLYQTALIEKIGHQSTGTALEKKACASYALAYCNAMINGTAPSPHSYWIGESTVDCVWSRGGYKTTAFSSEKAVLQDAYAQISAGFPCILHVTGNTEQHWVTLIGYKNVLSLSDIKLSNFIAIDPWDGEVFTVSDRYKTKTTYRLAVKA